MKNKTKIMLGLSALTAGTLAAGATGTFAWFTTNKSAKATYSNIVAVGTQGDLKASFAAVTDSGTPTSTGDNTSNVSMNAGATYITDVSSNNGIDFVQPDWVGEAGNTKKANKLINVSEKAGYFTQYLITLKNISKSAAIAADSVEVHLSSLKVTISGAVTGSSTTATADWVRVAIFSKDTENVSSKDITSGSKVTNKILDVTEGDLKGVYSNNIVATTEQLQETINT